MSAVTFEVLIVFMLLVLNGLFAMSEIAIVSARRVRLERRAEDGDAGANAALRLAHEPTQFLSAVQIGITLVGVLSGAFGGATISRELARWFEQVPAFAQYSETLGLGVVVALITYFSLVIGELVPKRIALANPEAIAARVARPMTFVARFGRPLVALLTTSTNAVLGLLRVRATQAPGLTEEEIRALVEEGTENGVVQPAEHRIVESVFRLGDQEVASIMTPRPDIEWVDVEDPPEVIRAELAAGQHARYVVCAGSLDRVLGIVHAEELLAKSLVGELHDLASDLRAVLWQPLYVPETMPVYRLIDELRRSRQHIALALDEFGGVQGIVSLDEILEALLGTMPNRTEQEARSIVRREDGSWLVDGRVSVEELASALDLDPMSIEERQGVHTVAGFVLARLGHIPQTAEHVEWEGWRFEVVDMDGRRIDTVLVTPVDDTANESEKRG